MYDLAKGLGAFLWRIKKSYILFGIVISLLQGNLHAGDMLGRHNASAIVPAWGTAAVSVLVSPFSAAPTVAKLIGSGAHWLGAEGEKVCANSKINCKVRSPAEYLHNNGVDVPRAPVAPSAPAVPAPRAPARRAPAAAH